MSDYRGECAICDETNRTMRLCAACRADPANEGWSEGEPAEHAGEVETLSTSLKLADLGGRRLRPEGDRKRVILQLVYRGAIREPYRNRGRARASVTWVWRTRALNLSEIAFLVGCTPQAVRKVVKKVLS
jgi:hypothetical protein